MMRALSVDLMKDDELPRAAADDDVGFGALRTDSGALPLRALSVRVDIVGLIYRLTVRQAFVNVHERPLEATYIFPLPDRAAVSRFRLRVAGRTVEGELQERGAARRAYDDALRSGHRAAIAEEERPGVFTMRVGNIPPGDEARVELTLQGPLAIVLGEATFRFPLVVAPRYIPGQPLPGESVGDGVAADTDAVPDASRISPPVLLPGFCSPVRLDLQVCLDPAGLPLSAVRSSLHTTTAEDAAGRLTLRVDPGERLDRDFVLRFALAARSIGSALLLCPDAPDRPDLGTFQLTLVPPADGARRRPRDLIFVLDRSGSMGGWKMVTARRAVARMVDALGDDDRFQVLAFDDAIEALPGGPASALWPGSDRQRFRAVEFLAGIEARGGTEMAQPLIQAVAALGAAPAGRDRVLVLITDGQVGNEAQILRSIGEDLRGIRAFTLGIDRAVNEGFLRQLASLGGGGCELVESEARLDEVMARVQRQIGAPVLSDLSLHGSGIQLLTKTITPARLPDLFPGVPAVVRGRYEGLRGESLASVQVRGQGAAEIHVAPVLRDEPALGRIWARGHLRDLEDQLSIRPDPALRAQIIQLSLQHHVLCRFTAFIAVDRAETVNPGGEQHHVIQPVEQPQDWEAASTRTGALGRVLPASPARAVMMAAQVAPPAEAASPNVAPMMMGSPVAPSSAMAPPATYAPAPLHEDLMMAMPMAPPMDLPPPQPSAVRASRRGPRFIGLIFLLILLLTLGLVAYLRLR